MYPEPDGGGAVSVAGVEGTVPPGTLQVSV